MSDKVVRKTTMTFIKCPACSSFFRMDGPSITYPFSTPETIEVPYIGENNGELFLPPGYVYQQHAHWIEMPATGSLGEHWKCSNCGHLRFHDLGDVEEIKEVYGDMIFCDGCGAIMDEEVQQE